MRAERMLYVSGEGEVAAVRSQLIQRAAAGDKRSLLRSSPRHWDLKKHHPPVD